MPAYAMGDAGDLSAYLGARAAAADGRPDVAARAYAKVLAVTPDDPVVAIRAYREALTAGDRALARRAAAALDKAGVAPADVPLLALGKAAHDADPAAVDLALVRLSTGALRVLVPSLRAWVAFARHQDPFAPLDATTDPVARRFAAETRALLLIATERPEGAVAVQALAGAGAATDLRLAAAQLLFGQGKDAAARALLRNDDPLFAAIRSPAPAKPDLAFGVSRLLARVAADLATGEPTPLSISLSSAAREADPDYGRASLLLALALARTNATENALAVLDGVPRQGPFAHAAATTRIDVLAAADRDGEALAVAQTLAEAKDAVPADWQRYGDLLVAASRYADAALWFRRSLDALPAPGWQAWLQYGGALEQAGDWVRAQPALERAVALAPSEPAALNYLGYARVTHGKRVAEATRLLERAQLLAPRDPSIADSLGWAFHLTGNPTRALPLIEGAARQMPTNAEVGEHLGDAYWHVGRRYEARYAWAAAALTADPKQAPQLAARLANGLPPHR